jgi:hypothetical protein
VEWNLCGMVLAAVADAAALARDVEIIAFAAIAILGNPRRCNV